MVSVRIVLIARWSSSCSVISRSPTPGLADVRQVEVVLVVPWIAQRRRFGVSRMGLLADIRRLEHGHAFGVSGHDAVLDPVVHHLDEVAGAVRTAMEIALFSSSADV